MNQYKLNQLKLISKQIQTKINDLQNPTCDCYSKTEKSQNRKLKKFICQLDIDVGFASGIHEILFCFVYGFFTRKTVILNFKWNKYIMNDSPTILDRLSLNGYREKWDDIFMTLSRCQKQQHLINQQQENKNVNDVNGNKNQNTIDKHNETDGVDVDHQIPQVINMPNDVLSRSLINYLPKEFGEKLMKLTETPNAWFHSQFIGYIMRPSKRLSRFLDQFKQKTKFHNPIVGIQVRRTDKISHGEAMYHRLDDYMLFVQDFYDKISLKTKTSSNIKTSNQSNHRLVYIASDDPSILSQFKLQYPNYKFISSSSMTSKSNSSASGVSGASGTSSSFLSSKYFFKSESFELFFKRYTNESLWALLIDVYLLAQTDHLVCTFSSAVSRLKQMN